MFELVVGELDMILGNLDERRSFEDLMMDIWVLRQAEERRSALRRLGDSLVRARAQYEQVKETNDTVLGEKGEAVSASAMRHPYDRSSSRPWPNSARPGSQTRRSSGWQ